MREVDADFPGRVRRATLLSLLRALGPAAMLGGTYFLVDGVSDYLATLTDINGPALALGEPVAGLALLLTGGGATAAAWVGRRGRRTTEADPLNAAGQVEIADQPCPRCLHINEPGARVCSACGSNLENYRFCSRCRRENAPGLEFCHHCGQQLCA